MGEWRDEWETTAYEAPVGTLGDFYRVRIRAERRRVVRYTVQFEVWIEGRHRPAIRYDSAHGGPHRDPLDWTGRVIKKDWLPDMPYDIAVKEAILEIRANWLPFREQFEKRKP